MSKKQAKKNGVEDNQVVHVSDEHKEFLIELVEEKPVLWNPTNADYPSLGKKQAEWLAIDNSFLEIYPDLRFGASLLKKTWESLTHTHRTTRTRMEGKSGDGSEDVEPNWKFWDKVSFLRSINTFSDQQMRATNVTPASQKKQTSSKSPGGKKAKLDPEFERLMEAVDSKKKMLPLTMEVDDLLHQVEDMGGKQMFLKCKENCMRIFYGDIMMVYAAIDLKKGDELLFSYVDPLQDYEKRQLQLRPYNFTCNCELCDLDKLDSYHHRRVKIFEQMEMLKNMSVGISRHHSMMIEEYMQEIRESYKHRERLQLQMYYPLRLMFQVYKELDEPGKSLKIIQEIYECLSEKLRIDFGPSIYVKMAELHKKIGHIARAKKCIQQAMALNKIRMGSDEQIFKWIYPQMSYLRAGP